MLAGIYALAVAAFLRPDKAKASLIRYNALWAIVGLVIMLPTYRWYFNSIPEAIRTTAAEAMPTVMARISDGWWLGLALTVIVILFGLVIPRWYHWVVGVIVMALGLLCFGEYEWMREAIRKPYVIHGYMYGNAIEVSDVDHLKADGMLPHVAYRTGDDGADLFRRSCRSCHTMDGYKPLKPKFDGTDEPFIAAMVRGIGVMRGNMPPFAGPEPESHLIAAHIYSRTDHRSLSEIYGLSGVELGRRVYEIRCGSCHQIGGYDDKAASLTGLSDQGYNDLLDMAGELADEMPDFTASDEERAALIEYLKTLPQGGAR
jgi:mono/diheme cytochrome c family protein